MTRLLSALLVLLSTVLPLAAQSTLVNNTYDPVSGTRIVVTALVSQLPTSGYLPVRVSLRNGGKIDRNWTLQFTSADSGWSDEGNEMRSDFSAACPAGQSTAYEFLVPLVTSFQESFSASTGLSLSVSATALPPLSASLDTPYDPAWPSIMMSEALFKKNSGMLDSSAQAHVSSASSSGGGSVSFAGQFDPREMSDQWLAYSGFDHCFLTDDEWRALSPGARSALLQWNRFGGSLLVYTTAPSLDLAALGIAGAESGVREATRSWGSIRILPMPSSGDIDPAEAIALVTRDLPSLRGGNRLESLRNDFSGSWPMHLAFGSKTAHLAFFIIVLIAFGILVGPVNLFVFAKAGQRHRLFITTPIISIGASLLLIVLIIFQDGFGGSGQRLILMEVRPDNSENAAYLSQEQIARTGVLFGTAFNLSEPAYFTPVLIGDSRWARVTPSNGGGSSRYQSKVLGQGQSLAGDWFQSRSEHGHLAETIRPTRGRIELVSANPNPVVTSTFEFPLETLFFLDPDGKAWTAQDVQQGRATTLNPASPAEFNTWIDNEIARFSPRNAKRLSMTKSRARHFFASSESAPGIDSLSALSWKNAHTVLTGPVIAP